MTISKMQWILKLLLLFCSQQQIFADLDSDEDKSGDFIQKFIKCPPERCWTKLKCLVSESHIHGNKMFKCESSPNLYCCDRVATKTALKVEEELKKAKKKLEKELKENYKNSNSSSTSTSSQNSTSNTGSSGPVSVTDTDPRLAEFGMLGCKSTLTATRIINGLEAPWGKYCFAALFFYGASATLPLIAGCGGTLISHRWVLTAAHCVTNLPIPLKLYRVRLGEHNIVSDPDCEGCPLVQSLGVVASYAHPAYDPDIFINDIGLVFIDKPARLDLPNICLGCLPWGDHQFPDFNNTNGFGAVGWGLTEKATPSLWLREARFPFVPESKCLTLATPIASVFCAGGTGTDTCNGDSGGPVVMSVDNAVINGTMQSKAEVIVGLTSYGPVFCGTNGLAGVYTHIGFFTDWILTMLSNNKNLNSAANAVVNNNNNINDNNVTVEELNLFDYI